MADTEITLQKEISPLIERALSFNIKDSASLGEASLLLSKANSTLDHIEEERMKVMRPLLDAQKAENARWKALKDPLSIVVTTMRTKISTFQTEAIKQANIEAAKIADRVGAGKGKLSVETAVRRIEDIKQPTGAIQTNEGTISFMSKKQLKITNIELIPHYYLLPNKDLILAKLKDGEVIPGVELETIQVPVNRRA